MDAGRLGPFAAAAPAVVAAVPVVVAAAPDHVAAGPVAPAPAAVTCLEAFSAAVACVFDALVVA